MVHRQQCPPHHERAPASFIADSDDKAMTTRRWHAVIRTLETPDDMKPPICEKRPVPEQRVAFVFSIHRCHGRQLLLRRIGGTNTDAILISSAVLPIAHAGIHMAAWSSRFPTMCEQTLWRVSCVGLTSALPLLLALTMMYLLLTRITPCPEKQALNCVRVPGASADWRLLDFGMASVHTACLRGTSDLVPRSLPCLARASCSPFGHFRIHDIEGKTATPVLTRVAQS